MKRLLYYLGFLMVLFSGAIAAPPIILDGDFSEWPPYQLDIWPNPSERKWDAPYGYDWKDLYAYASHTYDDSLYVAFKLGDTLHIDASPILHLSFSNGDTLINLSMLGNGRCVSSPRGKAFECGIPWFALPVNPQGDDLFLRFLMVQGPDTADYAPDSGAYHLPIPTSVQDSLSERDHRIKDSKSAKTFSSFEEYRKFLRKIIGRMER